jgi:hypothetical protein
LATGAKNSNKEVLVMEEVMEILSGNTFSEAISYIVVILMIAAAIVGLLGHLMGRASARSPIARSGEKRPRRCVMVLNTARTPEWGISRAVTTCFLAAALVACGAMAGQNTEKYFDDDDITTNVKSRLVHEKVASLMRVDVETTDGTVHMSGIVDHPEQKIQAGKIASQVTGVTGVENDLQVRGR